MRAVVVLALITAQCRAPEARPTPQATTVEVPSAEPTESASPTLDASIASKRRPREMSIEDCCQALADSAQSDPAPLSIYRQQLAASCNTLAKQGVDLPEFVERVTSHSAWVVSFDAGTPLGPCIDGNP